MSAYQKQIHDYLSGDLPREQEDAFFGGLSRNEEWRAEMQFQLRLERAMEQDLNAVAVPPATSSAIFESLGFRPPSMWSRGIASGARFAGLSMRRIVLLGTLSGMMLLAGVEYLALTSGDSGTRKILSTGATPAVHGNSAPQLAEKRVLDVASPNSQSLHGSAPPTALGQSGAQESSLTNSGQAWSLAGQAWSLANPPKQSSVSGQPGRVLDSLSPSERDLATRPNEPLRSYFNIGKLYSVHYLTSAKIIGVSDHGQIFVSEDSGHSWALQVSGVTSDLFGIHFIDTTRGVAVGAKGTILLTPDAGRSWHRVESGTSATLSTVRYVTHDTIYICGEGGTILRSATAGSTWKLEPAGVHANLFRMTFENGLKGEVRGANGTRITTMDGGETWNIIK